MRPPPPLEVGVVLGGRYALEECVGEGGAGSVYRARDRLLDNELVAVKVLRADRAADKKWVERFQREVRIAREIQHPNVCRVFDFARLDGHWTLTMEYAAGGTLRDVLEKRSLVGGRESVIIQLSDLKHADPLADARAACAGLAAIHAVGIVHRDVTPGNVLRLADGRLVLSDFGLAIGAGDETTFHGGTPKYMAPEVIARAPADQRADVWQLGYLLHEILFRAHPKWKQDGDRTFLQSPVGPEASAVDQAMAQLCADCLSHNRERRPANAVEVAGRLAAAEQAQPRSWTYRATTRAKRWARQPAVWGPLAAVGLALCIGKMGQVVMKRSLCKGGPDRIVGIWDEKARGDARAAFAGTKLASASNAFELVDRVLVQHLAKWLSTYKDACEARNLSTRMRQRWFEFSEAPRRPTTPAWVG